MTSSRILVVDGDPAELSAASGVLRTGGFEVLEAESGRRCLQLADALAPDLILLEAALPDADGIELCRSIKNSPSLTKILVALWSRVKSTSEDQAAGLEAGADACMARPVSDRELLARLNALLRIKRTETARACETCSSELKRMEGLSGPVRSSITADAFGLSLLSASAPPLFSRLIEKYETALEHAWENRIYQVAHPVSEALRGMAEQLGQAGAGPRDVVQIHISALKNKTDELPQGKFQAYTEAGRLLLIELMGYLTSFYRNKLLGN